MTVAKKVFSHGGMADLDAAGCRFLWEGDSDRRFDDVSLAEAVAASSAIPAFFRPVHVRSGGTSVGVFVDGGVADNLAMNVAKAFAVHIHPDRGQRYQHDAGGLTPFNRATSFVLLLDGSMPLAEKNNKMSWTRLFSMKRVTDAMMNQQVSDAIVSGLSFERNSRVPTTIISLQVGFPDETPVPTSVLRTVRTHLDSFTLQECAALAYCGYARTEQWLEGQRGLIQRYRGAQRVASTSFDAILPTYCGTWKADVGSVSTALRYSHRRLSPLRWLGRTIRL